MAVSDILKKYIKTSIGTGVKLTAGIVAPAAGALLSAVPSRKVGEATINFAKETAQSTLRGYAGLGSAITGKTLTPSTALQKAIYGTNEPLTARRSGAELPFIDEKSKFAAPIGFALAAMDLVPGGGGVKPALVRSLKVINKVDDAADVISRTLKITRKAAMKYADDAARFTSEKQLSNLIDTILTKEKPMGISVKNLVSKVDDPLITEARKIPTYSEASKKIQRLGGFSKIETMPLPQRNVYGADQLAQSLGLDKNFLYKNATEKGVDLSAELQAFDDIRGGGGNTLEFTNSLMAKLSKQSNAIDPLIAEARKYKNAEEFVKRNQKVYRGGDYLYHGTSAPEEVLESGFRKTGKETFAGGVSFTDDLEQAKFFSGASKPTDSNVLSVPIDRSKLISNEQFTNKLDTTIIPTQERLAGVSKKTQVLNKLFREEGIIGYKLSDKETILSDAFLDANRSNLKTKSQLTDIWKKAQGITTPKQVSQQSPQVLRGSTEGMSVRQPTAPAQNTLKEVSALASDSKKLANSQVNVNRISVSPQGKTLINKTIDDMSNLVVENTGTRLSNKEVVGLAEGSSKVLSRAIGRDSTRAWEAAMLRTRQRLAQAAETGSVDKTFIEDLLTVKTQGADIARKLQSLSIGADPKEVTSKQTILDAVLSVTDNVDEITKAAEGVDFNDFNQASAFYRKFIAPTAQEWLDLIRYNSMLSSPKTHINNAFSNAVNTSIVASLEKVLAGGYDFLRSTATGKPRKEFAGEGLAYIGAYLNDIGEAARRFASVTRGQRAFTNLDTRNIPVAVGGMKGRIANALSLPTRVLEASDQFFTKLTETAELASYAYRESKGVKVPLKDVKAQEAAAYRLFRGELSGKDQGVILDAMDKVTGMVQNLRSSDNPIVATIAKFTIPFLRTPMNIFKQGIEYSPAGFTTLYGAKNKTQQVAKAILGSTVFAFSSLMLMSDRLTFSEPTDPVLKDAFRAAGKQAYSVKIGNKWVSYQKLPPAIAFPFALTAALDEVKKEKGADDTFVDTVLSSVAKYGEFLADQTYFKSIGDLMNAAQGTPGAVSKLISNYPQQLIPFRALTGWLSRLFDATQRKVDYKSGFIDQQVQLLMLNIPGLSQKVPARLDAEGNPIPQTNRLLNALSPATITTENKGGADLFDTLEELRKLNKAETSENTEQKGRAQQEAQRLSGLPEDEAAREFDILLERDPELAKDVADIVETERKGITIADKLILQLGVENGERANYIYHKMETLPEEERADAYQSYIDKGIVTQEVSDQITELMENPPEGNIPQGKSSDKSVIDAVFVYAKAIGVDPVTAFNRIFTNQRIRRVDNGTVIIDRNTGNLGGDTQFSSDVRDEYGATENQRLDHTVPIQLGGADTEGNVRLVSEEEWKSYTPVENYLGQRLRSGDISKKEAQRLIKDFKNGKITAEDVYNYK